MIKKILKQRQVHLIIIVFVLGTFVGFAAGYNQRKHTYLPQEEKIILINKREPFSSENLRKYLKEINIKFPDIVYAQAVLETGHFTSPLFLVHRNLFGMKKASNRPQIFSYVTDNGYIGHNYWKESVLNYALFQSTYLNKLTKEQYLDYLKQYYAEDTSYVSRIKQIMKQNGNS